MKTAAIAIALAHLVATLTPCFESAIDADRSVAIPQLTQLASEHAHHSAAETRASQPAQDRAHAHHQTGNAPENEPAGESQSQLEVGDPPGHAHHQSLSLRAPCSCGCGDASGAAATSVRVGFALLPAHAPTTATQLTATPVLGGAPLPESLQHPVDHVPISSASTQLSC